MKEKLKSVLSVVIIITIIGLAILMYPMFVGTNDNGEVVRSNLLGFEFKGYKCR